MIPVLPEVCLCRNVVAPENFSRIFSQKWTAAIYANDFFEESSAKNVRRSRWRISWPRESSPATKKLQPENVRKSLWQWIQNEMKKSRNQKKKHAHEKKCQNFNQEMLEKVVGEIFGAGNGYHHRYLNEKIPLNHRSRHLGM